MRHCVLVVEDDPDIRETVCAVIEAEGFDPLCAANGREAVELLAAGRVPCLLILDLMMPVMTGWEVLDWLRHHPEHSSPVAIVSASALRPAAMLSGRPASGVTLAAVLQKPVNLANLLRTVHDACD